MPKRKSSKTNDVSSRVELPRWVIFVAIAISLIVGIFFVFSTFAAQRSTTIDTPNGATNPTNQARWALTTTIPTRVFCRNGVCSLNGNTNGTPINAYKRRSWNCPTGYEFRLRNSDRNGRQGSGFKAGSNDWTCLARVTPVAVVTPHSCTGSRVTVEGITNVCSTIAPQIQAMIRAARAAGVSLTGNAGRTNAEQIALRQAHCGSSYYAIYQAPASSCSPPTAIPGTSMHETGLAIDFDNCGYGSACHNWLSSNADDYGLYPLRSESWHWSTTGT